MFRGSSPDTLLQTHTHTQLTLLDTTPTHGFKPEKHSCVQRIEPWHTATDTHTHTANVTQHRHTGLNQRHTGLNQRHTGLNQRNTRVFRGSSPDTLLHTHTHTHTANVTQHRHTGLNQRNTRVFRGSSPDTLLHTHTQLTLLDTTPTHGLKPEKHSCVQRIEPWHTATHTHS